MDLGAAFVCCMQCRSALKFQESSTESPSSWPPVTVRFKDRCSSNSCSREQIHLVVVWKRRRWWSNHSLLTNRVPLHFSRDVKNGVRHWGCGYLSELVGVVATLVWMTSLPPHESTSSDVPLLHFEPPPSPNDTYRWRLHLEPPPSPSPNVLLRTTSDLSPGGFHLETPPSPAAPMAIEDSGYTTSATRTNSTLNRTSGNLPMPTQPPDSAKY